MKFLRRSYGDGVTARGFNIGLWQVVGTKDQSAYFTCSGAGEVARGSGATVT